MTRLRLILASGNPHKLEELRRTLPAFDVDALGRDDPPPEDGATFEDNARIKARFGRLHGDAGAWALGEDSGIEAVALDGRPGVHTARWAAGDPVGKMLAALDGAAERGARYVCVLVAIAPDGREVVARGTLEGMIAPAAAGAEGFGFDPVFVPEGETATVALLGDAWKDRNSHRARASAVLAELLR
ncbi:MAG TPA: non-canonical purine NTP pyrophosphatase [Gaiella sp.]